MDAIKLFWTVQGRYFVVVIGGGFCLFVLSGVDRPLIDCAAGLEFLIFLPSIPRSQIIGVLQNAWLSKWFSSSGELYYPS